jgi:hypothetical protein
MAIRFTNNYNRPSYLPADQIKEVRWSVSVNEEGHDLVQFMAEEHDSKRAVFSRAAMYLGMYHLAVSEGRQDLARKLEKHLNDHGIYPRESVIVRSEEEQKSA